MRPPERIPRVLDLIQEQWQRNPDLRLGQILVNAHRESGSTAPVFHFEDTALEAALVTHRDRYEEDDYD